jgi:glycosyltransferase involved in cell wall biosynthesis
MRILIVVDSINIEDSSGSKANVALIKNLKKAGFELLVYHYSRQEIQLDEIICVSIKEIKFSFLYFLSRAQREISKITKININPKIESLFGFSFTFFNDVKSIKKGLKKIENLETDWVLTLSKASSFRPHRALLGFPQWHSKWLAYVHDPYPMHSYPRPYDWVEPGHQYKRNFFLKIAANAFKLAYPSQYLAGLMEGYYLPAQGKTIIIPHQLNEQNIEKVELPNFLNSKHFNILHAGNMMSPRNPKGLIKAFELFLEQNPDAKKHSKLLFVGLSSCYDDYIKEKQQSVPQLFMSDGYVPFQKVILLQNAASVNVILEDDGTFSPFLPGKFPHCVAADKPILLLGPYFSESRRLLGEAYPYWSPIDKVDQITIYLTALYRLWKQNPAALLLNREDLKNYLSLPYLENLFNSELKNKY